ncbi:MAG: OsmC family protein [Leptolyngbyaceae cyanobacterium]
MTSVKVSSNASRYGQNIAIRQFQLAADEPPALGGDDAGPAPFEWILAGLGSCKAITLKMYAERKGWNLESVVVDLSYENQDDQPFIQAELALEGDLDEAQRQRLREISDRCPVQRMLAASVPIQTQLAAKV